MPFLLIQKTDNPDRGQAAEKAGHVLAVEADGHQFSDWERESLVIVKVPGSVADWKHLSEHGERDASGRFLALRKVKLDMAEIVKEATSKDAKNGDVIAARAAVLTTATKADPKQTEAEIAKAVRDTVRDGR